MVVANRDGLSNLLVLLNDRVEEAFAAYKATRAETSDALLSDDEAIRADFELLHRQTVHEVANDVPFIDLFRKPTLRRRCIIGFLTTFGCQATATIVINSKLVILSSSLFPSPQSCRRANSYHLVI